MIIAFIIVISYGVQAVQYLKKRFFSCDIKKGKQETDESSHDNELAVDGTIYFEDNGEFRFAPPVYIQRYQAVVKHLKTHTNVKKVVELGCAEINFFPYLKHCKGIEEIIFVDIDENLLRYHSPKVKPLTVDFLSKRNSPLHIQILKGNAAEPDSKLFKTDVVIAIELIEHMLPDDLETLPYCIFEVVQPSLFIVTTPNSDFNVLFPNFSGFRHPDHKFEWSRKEFSHWAGDIVMKYPAYSLKIQGVGPGPEGSSQYGCCSQMAVFIRNSPADVNLSLFKDNAYHLIEETNYPFELKKEETIEEFVIYRAQKFIRFAENQEQYSTDERIEIPLKSILLTFDDLEPEVLKRVLKDHGYNIEKIEGNEEAVVLPLYSYSDEGSEFSQENDISDNILERWEQKSSGSDWGSNSLIQDQKELIEREYDASETELKTVQPNQVPTQDFITINMEQNVGCEDISHSSSNVMEMPNMTPPKAGLVNSTISQENNSIYSMAIEPTNSILSKSADTYESSKSVTEKKDLISSTSYDHNSSYTLTKEKDLDVSITCDEMKRAVNQPGSTTFKSLQNKFGASEKKDNSVDEMGLLESVLIVAKEKFNSSSDVRSCHSELGNVDAMNNMIESVDPNVKDKIVQSTYSSECDLHEGSLYSSFSDVKDHSSTDTCNDLKFTAVNRKDLLKSSANVSVDTRFESPTSIRKVKPELGSFNLLSEKTQLTRPTLVLEADMSKLDSSKLPLNLAVMEDVSAPSTSGAHSVTGLDNVENNDIQATHDSDTFSIFGELQPNVPIQNSSYPKDSEDKSNISEIKNVLPHNILDKGGANCAGISIDYLDQKTEESGKQDFTSLQDLQQSSHCSSQYDMSLGQKNNTDFLPLSSPQFISSCLFTPQVPSCTTDQLYQCMNPLNDCSVSSLSAEFLNSCRLSDVSSTDIATESTQVKDTWPLHPSNIINSSKSLGSFTESTVPYASHKNALEFLETDESARKIADSGSLKSCVTDVHRINTNTLSNLIDSSNSFTTSLTYPGDICLAKSNLETDSLHSTQDVKYKSLLSERDDGSMREIEGVVEICPISLDAKIHSSNLNNFTDCQETEGQNVTMLPSTVMTYVNSVNKRELPHMDDVYNKDLISWSCNPINRCHSLQHIQDTVDKKINRFSLCSEQDRNGCDFLKQNGKSLELGISVDCGDACHVDTGVNMDDSCSQSRAADSGYPNTSERDMDTDMTPEQVDEMLSENDSSFEEREEEELVGERENVQRQGGAAPVQFLDHVENGDVANNNRDGEGNNMDGIEVDDVIQFEQHIQNQEAALPLNDPPQQESDSEDENKYISACESLTDETIIQEEDSERFLDDFESYTNESVWLDSSTPLRPDHHRPWCTEPSISSESSTSLIAHTSSGTLNSNLSSRHSAQLDLDHEPRETFPVWLLNLGTFFYDNNYEMAQGDARFNQEPEGHDTDHSEAEEHSAIEIAPQGDLMGGGEPNAQV